MTIKLTIASVEILLFLVQLKPVTVSYWPGIGIIVPMFFFSLKV